MGNNTQSFNFDVIRKGKETIKEKNEKINNDFNEINRCINDMFNSWSCKSIEVVRENHEKLKTKAKNRYVNQNNLINTLDCIINGYEDTEDTNEDLSKLFK